MDSLNFSHLLIGLAIMVVSSVGGLAGVGLIFVRLPADHFKPSRPRHFLRGRHPILRGTLLILKNFVGVLIVGAGVVMGMPGVPGPGILTILVGIMVLDFPGKLRLERWMVNRPGVIRAVNRLRAKYQQPPLELD